MSVAMALLLGVFMGALLATLWFYFTRLRHLQIEHELEIISLKQAHENALLDARKKSVNTSRAVLKGKMAEQFAPILPEFEYLPSDAKFLGDPIDYVIFSGYSEFREGLISADEIEVIFMDIKSGQARLTKGQQAIAQAIEDGRVRFETLHIDVSD